MVARTSSRDTPEGSVRDQSPAGARSAPLIRGPLTQPPGRTSLTASDASTCWLGPSGAYSVIRNCVVTVVVCATNGGGDNSAQTTQAPAHRLGRRSLRNCILCLR